MLRATLLVLCLIPAVCQGQIANVEFTASVFSSGAQTDSSDGIRDYVFTSRGDSLSDIGGIALFAGVVHDASRIRVTTNTTLSTTGNGISGGTCKFELTQQQRIVGSLVAPFRAVGSGSTLSYNIRLREFGGVDLVALTESDSNSAAPIDIVLPAGIYEFAWNIIASSNGELTLLSADMEFQTEPNVCVPDVTTTETNPGDPGRGEPDGFVNGADLSFFVEAWLAGCP